MPIAAFMAIITTSTSTNHVQAETKVVNQQEPQSTQSDREIMSAPYSTCQCPWRYRHCPKLEHCSKVITTASKDHQCPRSRILARYTVLALVARNAPLGCTSPPSFKALDPKTHAHTRTNTGTPTSTSTRATGNEALMHTRTLALGREGHSHMRRWVRRHGGHESSGDQRRKHRSDDHRPAANAKQKRRRKVSSP